MKFDLVGDNYVLYISYQYDLIYLDPSYYVRFVFSFSQYRMCYNYMQMVLVAYTDFSCKSSDGRKTSCYPVL